MIPLTKRVKTMLSEQTVLLRCPFVFFNPETGTAWVDLADNFNKACAASGLNDLWFHDLRRSFITKARRAGGTRVGDHAHYGPQDTGCV